MLSQRCYNKCRAIGCQSFVCNHILIAGGLLCLFHPSLIKKTEKLKTGKDRMKWDGKEIKVGESIGSWI